MLCVKMFDTRNQSQKKICIETNASTVWNTWERVYLVYFRMTIIQILMPWN